MSFVRRGVDFCRRGIILSLEKQGFLCFQERIFMGGNILSFADIREASGGGWIGAAPNPDDGVAYVKTDSREDCRDSLFIAIPGENFDGHNYLGKAAAAGAKALCVERAKLPSLKLPPGVPVIAADSSVAAYQSLAERRRMSLKNLRVAGVTGSCGKTSAKEILRFVFEEAFGKDKVIATEANTNNQIGVPQNIFRLNESHLAAVIEMGTNHFGEIAPLSKTARPNAALITCVGRCHLEHFGSTAGVAKEKSDIFKFMLPGGTAVIPEKGEHDATLAAAAKDFKIMRFGVSANADVSVRYLGGNPDGSSFIITEKASGKSVEVKWRLSGAHQALNAAAACCLALSFGVSLETAAAGMAKCVLPGMRMRTDVLDGVTWINDAYNANPDSMAATVEWLSGFADPAKLVLAMGDMRELGESAEDAHRETLRLAAAKFGKSRIIVVGELFKKTSAEKEFSALPGLRAFGSSEEAAPELAALLKPGDTVLLKASRGTRLEKVLPPALLSAAAH
jgi:UDP-N-acetylmuramoyl-tripeptide--D-alanyl-D-alanine ligase